MKDKNTAVASEIRGKYGRSSFTLPNKYSIIDSFKDEKANTIARGGKLNSNLVYLSGREEKLIKVNQSTHQSQGGIRRECGLNRHGYNRGRLVI